MPTVDVAIVNWNTSRAAVDAAHSYLRSDNIETNVTIFDNASEPDQRVILEAPGSGISVTFSDENLGYGRAANRTLIGGTGEFVLISNADVEPEPGAVEAMVRAFEAEPDPGLVSPVTGGASGYHDELPGPLTLVVRIAFGRFNRKRVRDPQPGETTELGQPAGACLLTSRALWEQVGGFDERFFLWYEDVDLAKRIRSMGRRNLIVGDARVRHTGGSSFLGLDGDAKDRLRVESIRLYAQIHHRSTSRLIDCVTPLALTTRRIARHLTGSGGTSQG